MAIRNIYLRIEEIEDYSPVEPQDKEPPPVQYLRDGMRNPGHEDGTISERERDARAMTAIVYREYVDPACLIPRTTKIVAADVNEPVWDRRVPGTVLYAIVGDTLKIHVYNADRKPHSFHIHGLEYGIDSDGAWPMGTQTTDGRRSDEICPGQSWTYTFRVTYSMVGAWPFHDHSSVPSRGSVNRGLFGGLIVLRRRFRVPIPNPLPRDFGDVLKAQLVQVEGVRPLRRDTLRPRGKLVLNDHYDVLREWLFREQFRFPVPVQGLRLHVPVFFHKMASDEAKPIFGSGELEENAVFTHQFDDAGSWAYLCTLHPMTMKGTVEVVPGAPAAATVNILDNPQMGFYPDTVNVAPGGTVTWTNQSMRRHTVTSARGASIATHCINGRGFVGNSPTIVAQAGQSIRWYVFNLDFGHEWHNFHPHNQRWKFANENVDVRSMGPAESFTVDSVAPTVLILPDDIAAIQDPSGRPADAKEYRLTGDFVFHCHVHHHMNNGMIGVVRSYQDVWLTPEMKLTLEGSVGIHLYDSSNPIPDVDVNQCTAGEGVWEELAVAPDVTCMHACLLPNSQQVLYWGYTRTDQTRLFDPAGPSVTPPANQPASLPGMNADLSDLWSSEHTFLDDEEGTLLAHGGLTGPRPVRSFLFDPPSKTWRQTGDTADNRFYSTTLTLDDGRALTLYGSASKSIEVYEPGPEPETGTWSAPVRLPESMDHHTWYPWTYLLPDGKLVIAGPHDPTHRFDWNPVSNVEAFPMISGNRSTGGEKGTSVLLPLRPPRYEAQVIVIGGNTAAARKTAEILDLSAPAPAWQPLPNLFEERADQVNSVLLPDGRVLVAGGANAVAGGGPVELLDSKNPAGGWSLGPSMTYHRAYHSAMVLLADGSLLFGGDPNSQVFERYLPRYFFRPRPQITSAPTSVGYGARFDVDSPQASIIDEVMLLRPGAVTHGFNMSQRAIECSILGRAGGTVEVEAPPHAQVAPPGWYLLFLIDGNRVPSEGHWVRITS